MDYCGPARLARSEFLGWDPLDQALALAWHQRLQQKCSGCGLHPDLTDPARGGDPDSLELTSVLCRPCEIREGRQQDYDAGRVPGEHQVWQRTTAERTAPAPEQVPGQA